MKDQIKISEFDDYALPVEEDVVQRLIGRIVNMNTEESNKLNESNIGMINLSDDHQGEVAKIQLQLSEIAAAGQ